MNSPSHDFLPAERSARNQQIAHRPGHRAGGAAVIVLAVAAAWMVAVAAAPVAAVAATPHPLAALERVSYATSSSGVSRRVATVDCPSGKVVVGAGWTTNPSSNELLVEDLIPSQSSVTAVVREDETGYASNWSLTVHAVCAHQPPGWTIVSAYSATNSASPKWASPSCPSNTVLLGGGFSQSDQTGQVVQTDLNFGSGGVTSLAYEDDTGHPGTWWVGGHAICAEPPIGWEFLGSSNQTAYPTTSEFTGCSQAAGKMAISVGGDLDFAYGEVVLKGLKTFSYGGADYGVAYAAEDEDGAPTAWDLIAEVICVST